jgi:hypothetical protein
MKFKIVAIATLALLLGACRIAPAVYTVNEAPVISNLSSPAKEDVRKAILRAGATLGWQVKDNGPNAMIAVLNLRTHSATVDIPYNAKQYSILYKDSANLNYDGTSIHKNYTGWVQNLQKGIEAQLKAM